MTVQDVIYLEDQTKALPMISTYVGNSTDSDSTTLAMKSFFSGECDIHPVHVSPFSSARKWGSMTYEGHGTVFLGAPEFLIDNYELPNKQFSIKVRVRGFYSLREHLKNCMTLFVPMI
ncbi:hypothetical protein MGH68_12875 [Erysipelothrix sp. D19-032]